MTFLFTFLTGLSIQIATNFANDYFDFLKGADTAARKGPRRVTQAGLVSLPTMKRAVFIAFAFAAVCSLYLAYQAGPVILLLALLYILLSLAYTAGPFPLAYLGLGDLFVLFFYGAGATLITYYLQTHIVSLDAAILGLSPGLISTAILTVNNLRDVDEDRKSNKKTVCVRFGERFGRIEYTVCWIAGCSIPCFYGYYLQLLTLIPALVPLKAVWTVENKTLLNVTLAQTGKLLLLFSFFLGFSIIGKYGF
jgi:1,4-dihydroxy-2-naphthoate octaprenyltransferase